MKKPSEKVGRRPTRGPGTEGRDEAATTVVVEPAGATTAAPPAPYRVVWRCATGPREADAGGADAESAPTNDESR